MKHRSTIAFVLLASALFAAPQVSQDLSAMKSALGSRVRGEILSTFLSLNSGAAQARTTPARFGAQVAACKGSKDEPAPHVWTAKPDRRPMASTARSEKGAAKDSDSEIALAVEPLQWAELVRAEIAGNEGRGAPVASRSLPRGARSEFAMLIPPGSGVDAPAVAGARPVAPSQRSAARRKAETEKHVAYFATRFEQDAKNVGEQIMRDFNPSMLEANGVKLSDTEMKLKVLKLRRQGAKGGASPAPRAVAPVAALVPPDVAPPASGCAESASE